MKVVLLSLCRYRNAELQNGRWAMLGVAGIIFPAVRNLALQNSSTLQQDSGTACFGGGQASKSPGWGHTTITHR